MQVPSVFVLQALGQDIQRSLCLFLSKAEKEALEGKRVGWGEKGETEAVVCLGDLQCV